MVPVLISPLLQPFAFVHVKNRSILTWDSPFDPRGAIVRPHLSLVGDRLPTPYSLTSPSPFPPPNGPLQFTLHVFKDDITNQLHSLIQYYLQLCVMELSGNTV